jgi:hypothetical protein
LTYKNKIKDFQRFNLVQDCKFERNKKMPKKYDMQMHDMMAPKVNFGISFILSSKVSNPFEI